ncbi:BAR domain-containing protein [Aphelenchoides fujianensis]|nr:BAR domain-containing protein [Aphelenchoides fujianensis]
MQRQQSGQLGFFLLMACMVVFFVFYVCLMCFQRIVSDWMRKPFCTTCGVECPNRQELEAHAAAHGQAGLPAVCAICGLRFEDCRKRNAHEHNLHSFQRAGADREKNGAVLVANSQLAAVENVGFLIGRIQATVAPAGDREKMFRSTGVQSAFACYVCGLRFLHVCHRRGHEVNHEKGAEFKCSVCQQLAMSAELRNAHEALAHACERPPGTRHWKEAVKIPRELHSELLSVGMNFAAIQARASSPPVHSAVRLLERTEREALERPAGATTTASNRSSARNDERSGGAHSPLAGPQRSGFKKLFMKLGERVGAVERTEYSAHFLNACRELDQYKVVIEDVAQKLCVLLQQNPKHVPQPLGAMHVEYAEGRNPFELLQGALHKAAGHLEEAPLQQHAEVAKRHAGALKDFQRKGRRALHQIRTFLNVDFDAITEQRRLLNRARQDMDYARHELRNAKSAESIRARNSVIGLLDGSLQQREKHALEVIAFYNYHRQFHKVCFGDHAAQPAANE